MQNLWKYWPWRCRTRRAAASRVVESCRSRSRKPWLQLFARLVYSRSFSDTWLVCRGVRLALELSQRTCRIFVRACEGWGYATTMRSRWRFVCFCQVLLPRLPTPLLLLLRPDSPLLDVPPRLYSCENIASLLRSSSGEPWCIREKNRFVLRLQAQTLTRRQRRQFLW